MPTGGIDSSGTNNKNEEKEEIRGPNLHRRGHRSEGRISGSVRGDVPLRPRPKRGRR